MFLLMVRRRQQRAACSLLPLFLSFGALNGEEKTIVFVLVNFTDHVPPVTAQQVREYVWGTRGNNDPFPLGEATRLQSYGAVTFGEAPVYDVQIGLAADSAPCDYQNHANTIDGLVQTQHGVDLAATYSHRVYILPNEYDSDGWPCQYAGAWTNGHCAQPGRNECGCPPEGPVPPGKCKLFSRGWITRNILHELGHNFGLAHAVRMHPPGVGEDPLGTWTVEAGADITTCMAAGGQVGFNAPERVHLGWIPSNSITDWVSAGRVNLQALHLTPKTAFLPTLSRVGSASAIRWPCLSIQQGGACTLKCIDNQHCSGATKPHAECCEVMESYFLYVSYSSDKDVDSRIPLAAQKKVHVHSGRFGITALIGLLSVGEFYDGAGVGDPRFVYRCADDDENPEHARVVLLDRPSLTTSQSDMVLEASALCQSDWPTDDLGGDSDAQTTPNTNTSTNTSTNGSTNTSSNTRANATVTILVPMPVPTSVPAPTPRGTVDHALRSESTTGALFVSSSALLLAGVGW